MLDSLSVDHSVSPSCPDVCMSLYPTVSLLVGPSPSALLSFSTFPPGCLSISLSVCKHVYLSVSLFAGLSVSRPLDPPPVSLLYLL